MLDKNRPNEAIAQINEALRINPEFAEAHNNLGFVLLQKGLVERGMAECREALRINPAYPGAHYNLGNALFQQRRMKEAIIQYREAVEADSAYVEAFNNLGFALLQEGEIEEAIGDFRTALHINPGYAEGQYNLGNALFKEGRSEEAISHARKALDLMPGNPAIQDSLAWMLATAPQLSLRDGASALKLASMADRATGGRDPQVLHTLAAAYAETGQYPNAAQTARNALQEAESQSNTKEADALRREIELYQAGHRFDGTP